MKVEKLFWFVNSPTYTWFNDCINTSCALAFLLLNTLLGMKYPSILYSERTEELIS